MSKWEFKKIVFAEFKGFVVVSKTKAKWQSYVRYNLKASYCSVKEAI